MKPTALAAAALFLAAATSTAPAQTAFAQYTSPDGAFTVLFPGTPAVYAPQTGTGVNGTPFTERAYMLLDDANYGLVTFDYATDMQTADLSAGASAQAASCGGTYTVRNHDSYRGQPGVLVEVSCPADARGGALVVLEQVVVHGKRVYQMSYGAPTINPDRSSTFLNSLHIN